MTFERIVPSGKNAYFPFQMSAAGLNPTATIYEANDASGADTALNAGVSVDDMGGGLYALKVLSANMTADRVYYGVVTSGNESVRIPMWAYAPANHIAQVLSDVATVDTVVDGIAAELADGTYGLSALKTLIDTETSAIDSALTTIDNEVGALQTDVTAILADTNELQGDWANGGRLDLLLDRTVAASEAAEDLIGLAADTSASATVFGKIAALSADVATVDGNVDSIKAAIEDATYGLSALETRLDSVDTDLGNIESKVDTVDTVVDGIASALADGTTGLAALKAEIDANEAKLDTIDGVVDSIETKVDTIDTVVDSIETKVDTIDGVVDGLATEIGDVSAVFAGGAIAGTPVSVAEGLKKIYDNLAGTDVWDDNLSTYTTAGTAGYLLREAHEELTDATTGLAAIKAKANDIETATTDIQTKLGAPVGATFSADIAAIKAVVDTLQVSVNARLVPSVPSEVYSAASSFRLKLGLTIQDGETGSLEDPDVVGTNGAAEGQALIIVQAMGAGAVSPTLYDAPTAGSALGNTDAVGLTSWKKMSRTGTGQFEAWAEITAYYNRTVEVQFMCFDSDPLAVKQTFTTSRFMTVRSPIQASFGGGAF
jgi:peptidoglycan hydrolase CwlO-like protein